MSALATFVFGAVIAIAMGHLARRLSDRWADRATRLALGVVCAFAAGFFLPAHDAVLAGGFASAVVAATLGALALVLVTRVVAAALGEG
jgi:uncharacterized membrane protein YeaQ/YmgE (transglycosylase-associated protein family)